MSFERVLFISFGKELTFAIHRLQRKRNLRDKQQQTFMKLMLKTKGDEILEDYRINKIVEALNQMNDKDNNVNSDDATKPNNELNNSFNWKNKFINLEILDFSEIDYIKKFVQL